MAGQTVEVFRPEVILTTDGFTGPAANKIEAFFGAPPPPPMTVHPVTGSITFYRYAVAKAIPTSLLLPCGGTGKVYFVPLPMTPLGPTRSAIVPVRYVGQP